MKNRTSIELRKTTLRKPIRLALEPQNEAAERWLHVIVRRLIEQRAQEIFHEQNCLPNRDLENWLQAEAEMRRFLEEVEGSLNVALEAGTERNRCRN